MANGCWATSSIGEAYADDYIFDPRRQSLKTRWPAAADFLRFGKRPDCPPLDNCRVEPGESPAVQSLAKSLKKRHRSQIHGRTDRKDGNHTGLLGKLGKGLREGGHGQEQERNES